MSENVFIEIKLKCIFLFNQTTAIVMVKKSTKDFKSKTEKKHISFTSHSLTDQMYLNSVLITFSSLFSLYYFASLSVQCVYQA